MKIEAIISNIRLTLPNKEQKLLNDEKLYIKINIILFKKIKIFTKNFDRGQIEEIIKNKFFRHKTKNLKEQISLVIKERLNSKEYNKIKFLAKKYAYLMPNIDNLNIKLKIGTEDSYTTSIVFGIISTILNVYLKNIPKKHINIKPIFENENLVDIDSNITFSITLIRLIRLIKIYRTNIVNVKKKIRMYKFDNLEQNI